MSTVRFAVACPNSSKVFLAGDFNGWDPCARRMKRVSRDDDIFVALVDLEPGRYEYRYVVDDEWTCCPEAPRVSNGHGEENSVVEVPEPEVCCE
jgi:1,4-alpha-glucan branching enzyme